MKFSVAFFIALSLLFFTSCKTTSVGYRLLHYGDSDINDFKRFPAHSLTASTKPQAIKTDTGVFTYNKAELHNFLGKKNTLAFLVMQGNTIVHEDYFDGYTSKDLIQAFSVTKSVTNLLTGCAIDDKLISSENDFVVKYIPELKGRGFDSIPILQLLQMTAPLKYIENGNPFGRHARFYYTAHIEDEVLKLKARPNGKRKFVYRSGDLQLLGLILKRALNGKSLSQYLQEKVREPLGMESPALWTADNDSTGLEKTFCCLATTVRDLAKIGRLYLNNGQWNGKQIVSENWIRKTLQPLQNKNADMVYNYNWWLYPKRNAFVAIGKDGQFIYVRPDKDLVIVRMGKNIGHINRYKWFDLFDNIASKF
ncbi:MAG: serine hydrolase [Chitinophagales bacterium]